VAERLHPLNAAAMLEDDQDPCAGCGASSDERRAEAFHISIKEIYRVRKR
jgi:hypothetical protein